MNYFKLPIVPVPCWRIESIYVRNAVTENLTFWVSLAMQDFSSPQQFQSLLVALWTNQKERGLNACFSFSESCSKIQQLQETKS